MSTNARTARFMQSVPRTPLRQHIEYLHEMGHWAGIYGSAMDMFEHHLHAIAVATAEPLRYGNAVVPPSPERYETSITPPYDPDRMARDIVSMSKRVTEVVQRANESLRRATAPKTPEQAEARARRRYERQCDEQRAAAKMHLRNEVRRVRAELGLPENTSPTKRGQS